MLQKQMTPQLPAPDNHKGFFLAHSTCPALFGGGFVPSYLHSGAQADGPAFVWNLGRHYVQRKKSHDKQADSYSFCLEMTHVISATYH